jgi:hypothetical protein
MQNGFDFSVGLRQLRSCLGQISHTISPGCSAETYTVAITTLAVHRLEQNHGQHLVVTAYSCEVRRCWLDLCPILGHPPAASDQHCRCSRPSLPVTIHRQAAITDMIILCSPKCWKGGAQQADADEKSAIYQADFHAAIIILLMILREGRPLPRNNNRSVRCISELTLCEINRNLGRKAYQRYRVFAVEEFRDRPVAQHRGQVRPGSVREWEGLVFPDRDQWAVA